MNKKLIALSMATVMLSTTMASEIQQKGLNKIEVNAAAIKSKPEVCGYLKINWENSKSGITLTSLNFTDKVPASETDLELIIPGEIEGRQVHIEPAAFSDLQSNTLRLHLQFKEANGNKVQMPADSEGMFLESTALYSIDFSGASTEQVTNMRHMFDNCKNLKTLNLSNLNAKNVKDMSRMFYQCGRLTEVNASEFETKNVQNMGHMFYGCSSLIKLDLSSFNTLNVKNMESMFYDCSSLTKLDLSSFNTLNVKNMESMFYGCSSLTQLDLSSFNTQNVENVHCMFYGCSNLTQLDLSNFDTKNVEYIGGMFAGCETLKEVTVGKLDIRRAKAKNAVFDGCNEEARDKITSAFVKDVSAKSDLDDCKNKLYQIYWHFHCNSQEKGIRLIELEDGDMSKLWILDDYYKDSRTKVIGEAIADCLTGQNEFAGKKPEDIITFEDKAPQSYDPESYAPENWNAVILYNYVHEMINSDNPGDDKQENQYAVDVVLKGKLPKIEQYYAEQYNVDKAKLSKDLNKAVKDIQAYVDTLWLDSCFEHCLISRKRYNAGALTEDVVPAIKIAFNDERTFKFNDSFDIESFYKQDNACKYMLCDPTFKYYNGLLYISSLKLEELYLPKGGDKVKKEINWSKYDEFKDHCKWLKQLLGPLVEIPDEELFNKLNKHKPVFYEALN